jgi:hypothetical protein
MDEERRTLPFECRGCWHVWEEEYQVRNIDDEHGNAGEVWLREGVPVPPPSSGAICPQCGCQQATTFPTGYLAHHPELVTQDKPRKPDARRLHSPVPPRRLY